MKKLIIDCDPGQDDALAILLALGSKKVCLEALTVVGGNSGLENCYTNAKKTISLANKPFIPIYKGSSKPLVQKLVTLEQVFGESGLQGSEEWPLLDIQTQKKSAPEFLTDVYHTSSDISLIAIAPQTNIALAFQKNPLISQNIPSLTIMGGCVFPEPIHGLMGNISFDENKTYAEYNFAVDPEATQIVFNAGIKKINLIGLDITRDVLYNQEVDKSIRLINTLKSHLIADMLSTIGKEDEEDYKNLKQSKTDPVRAIHDAVAVAYEIEPDIFKTEMLPLKIDMTGTKGRTIIDENGIMVNVIRSVNKKAFFDLIIESIKNL